MRLEICLAEVAFSPAYLPRSFRRRRTMKRFPKGYTGRQTAAIEFRCLGRHPSPPYFRRHLEWRKALHAVTLPMAQITYRLPIPRWKNMASQLSRLALKPDILLSSAVSFQRTRSSRPPTSPANSSLVITSSFTTQDEMIFELELGAAGAVAAISDDGEEKPHL